MVAKASEPLAPPIPNATAFYLRFLTDITGVRDAAGRPLHEVDFREELTVGDAISCPYPGCRHGQLMNKGALRVIGGEWQAILENLSGLVASVWLKPFEACTATAFWARSLLPMFLPLYLLRKSASRKKECMRLPGSISGLFKVMLDVPTTIDLMLAQQWARGSERALAPRSSGSISAFAERSGVLNNGEWSCAAPPGLMNEFLELLWRRADVSTGDESLLSKQLDMDAFGKFARAMISQYASSIAFQIATAYLMESCFSRLPGEQAPQSASRASLSAYERRRRILLDSCAPEGAVCRIVAGFCDLAEADAPGSSTAQASFRAAATAAIAPSVHLSSADLLDLQIEVEHSFRAVAAGQLGLADAALGIPLDRRPRPDFCCFQDEDFPTVILRERLGG